MCLIIWDKAGKQLSWVLSSVPVGRKVTSLKKADGEMTKDVHENLVDFFKLLLGVRYISKNSEGHLGNSFCRLSISSGGFRACEHFGDPYK